MIFRLKINGFAVSLTLIFCCLKCCHAENSPDVAELALQVIQQLVPALKLQLTPDELSKWNASSSAQQLLCVEDTIKDWFTRPTESAVECSSVLDSVDAVNSSDGLDVHDEDPSSKSSARQSEYGSGYDDSTALPFSTVSKVFCNQACGDVLLSAYRKCEFFEDALGKRVNHVLEDVCRKNGEDEYCLNVIARFTLSDALLNCTAEEGCPTVCKLHLEEISKEFGCCLHFAGSDAVGSGAFPLSEMLSKCELPDIPECKELTKKDVNDITETDTAIAMGSSTMIYVLSVCVVTVLGLSLFVQL